MPHFDRITDVILPEATEEEAIELAHRIDEYDTHSATIAYANYVDTINGFEVYYDYGGDYYFFVEADVEDDYDGQPDEYTEWLDYYGEYRGGYAFVHEDIESVLDKHDLYSEWENPGCMIVYDA